MPRLGIYYNRAIQLLNILKIFPPLFLLAPAMACASAQQIGHNHAVVAPKAPKAMADAEPRVCIRNGRHMSALTAGAFADWENRHPGIVAGSMPLSRGAQARDDFAEADSDHDHTVSAPELASLIDRRDALKIAGSDAENRTDDMRARLLVARWVENRRPAI